MEGGLLITADQLKVMARSQGLAAGVMEKDYALTWLLKGLYGRRSRLRDSLVLKGGTAIRKVYFPGTWRFSEDLDFTSSGGRGAAGIREAMEGIFGILQSDSGLSFSIDSFHATEGSIVANVQFLGPLGFRNRIKHDINLTEKIIVTPERRIVKSNYPDLRSFTILAHSLDEVLVEKIRSIMQRGYSRDYYDVWRLTKERRFRASRIKGLLIRKCEAIGVKYEPRLLFDRERIAEARTFWEKGLGYLTRELPDFKVVVSELREALDFLVSNLQPK